MRKRMQQTGKSGPGLLGKCVHVSKKGFRLPGFCLKNHECWHCAFDQWIEFVEEGDRRIPVKAA